MKWKASSHVDTDFCPGRGPATKQNSETRSFHTEFVVEKIMLE